MYTDGKYLEKNPSWHVEDSPWKALQVASMVTKHGLTPELVYEIGCGAGEVLIELAPLLSESARLLGFEISPQAFALCEPKATDRVTFYNEDLLASDRARADLLLVIDVFEHVEDYLGFVRSTKDKGTFKVFHIPLDLSVQTVMRAKPIMAGRESVGHLHYFTKETALATLVDAGHEIVDYSFTASSLDLPNRSWKASTLLLPRRFGFRLSSDLTARVLGGYSLLVLTK